MDDGTFSPNSTFGAFPDSAMDLDFMDELLFEGCWLETSSGVVNDPSHSFPYSEPNTGPLNINLHPHQQVYQGQTGSKFPENASLVYPKVEELRETHPQNHQGFETPTFHGQCGSFLVQGNEAGRSLWIVPRASSSSMPVQHRLMQALSCLKDFIKDKNVLIQIWVPVKREGKHVLTTVDQPYTLNSDCKRLASYRDVSERYHFVVDADSMEFTGLPGRVFLRQLPEWTPDVRLFENNEYPRIDHAHQFDVHGSLAVPVFEQGGRTCLGVVEFVTTSQTTNYRDVENVCKALEAFDLRSSKDSTTSCAKAHSELYNAALTKIAEVLKSFCKNNNIPLALTWAPCVQESKGECQRYELKTPHYVLTSACFVADEKLLDFRAECSEHQLLQGQGIVGRAFAINKQCFAADITAFSRSDYPLSHHAKVFELHAAIAIPLQGLKSGLVEYVLEFFLPKECREIENKNWILNSLSIVIQQSCQSLHLAMEKELEEVVLPIREMGVTSDASSPSKETSPEPSSWNIKEPQQRGKGFSVSWENKEQEPKEEFKITTHWDDARAESYHKQVFPEFGQFQHSVHKSSVAGGGESSLSSRRLEGSRKAGEKRRTKTEKTISLQVLRQYFAGSLKDAAKSIGVCPTTLKRICRQHGITRWPSRKIKKVGHSLRKLQLVIDSVQGAEGAIQIGSFYNSFPELSSPKISGNGPVSSIKTIDHSTQLNPQADNALFSNGATVLKSPSSSCSQSSGSSTCCSTGAKQRTTTIKALSSGDAVVGDSGGMLKRARSDAELHALNQDEPKLLARSQSHKLLSEHANLESRPPLPKGHNHNLRDSGTFRVKATFGEEKIRFSLQPNWGFRDIQQEIARRFSIEDISRMDLKYLDDDDEWVLLTCDADLEECIDIYKSSQSHTIKISLHGASHLKFAKVVHSTAPL